MIPRDRQEEKEFFGENVTQMSSGANDEDDDDGRLYIINYANNNNNNNNNNLQPLHSIEGLGLLTDCWSHCHLS